MEMFQVWVDSPLLSVQHLRRLPRVLTAAAASQVEVASPEAAVAEAAVAVGN